MVFLLFWLLNLLLPFLSTIPFSIYPFSMYPFSCLSILHSFFSIQFFLLNYFLPIQLHFVFFLHAHGKIQPFLMHFNHFFMYHSLLSSIFIVSILCMYSFHSPKNSYFSLYLFSIFPHCQLSFQFILYTNQLFCGQTFWIIRF